MKVAILLGRLRKDRNSFHLAHYLQKLLSNKDIQADFIDLALTPLPIYGEKGGNESHVDDIGNVLNQSDAILLVSPEYHGGFSGAMKNALDYFWIEFKKKPVGVATTSAGRMAGIDASTQLQHVILSLGAYLLPLKLLIPEVQHAFDDSSAALSDSTSQSAITFIDEFLWFAEAIENRKKGSPTADSEVY